ncbi:MAG: Asp-tRNA(Asn)/Glu-tRNA(Gln) amidotransferase GatCAB subunit A, partial [Clostridia bacterium]|nr:Asp-tRNA(Asn)/Glu-tRNA(Gln) amidotransferase GatCAB subunit A [Clostridia bacterium]
GHRSQKARNMEELYTLSRGEGFGWEVKKRILFGSYVLSKGQKEAYYQRARALARQISEEYEKAFLQVDLLLCPVTPELPFEIKDGGTPVYEGDLFTVSANLAGIPALAMPCEKTDAGLPVGMQLMAAKGREDLLFAAARVFEGEKKYGTV